MDSPYGEIPRSIMFPSSFGDKAHYRPYLEHYKAELFGRALHLRERTVAEAFGSCLGFDPP